MRIERQRGTLGSLPERVRLPLRPHYGSQKRKYLQLRVYTLSVFFLNYSLTGFIFFCVLIRQVYMDPLKKIQVEGYAMFAEPELLFGNLDELCCVRFFIEFIKFLVYTKIIFIG